MWCEWLCQAMALVAAAARAGAWRAMAAKNSGLLTSLCAPGPAMLPSATVCRAASGASQEAEEHAGGGRGGAGAAVGVSSLSSSGAQPRGPVPRPREGISKVALKSLEKRLELIRLPHDVSRRLSLSFSPCVCLNQFLVAPCNTASLSCIRGKQVRLSASTSFSPPRLATETPSWDTRESG